MQRKNPIKHAKEAWGQDGNPFPSSAIGGEDSADAPYDSEILAKDRDQFIQKLIVKAAMPPGREFGFLWSQGQLDDTGFGKTRLMMVTRSELNRDFGKAIAEEYGLPNNTTIAGVWASMKTTGITGIYPLLFNAIVDGAKPEKDSLIERCWAAIATRTNTDPDDKSALSSQVENGVHSSHRKLFPGYPSLREDITRTLSSCDRDAVLRGLEDVKQATRTRNGLAYFEAFYSLVRAAGVGHLFVFIDQLEDLATAKNIPRATRQREVGRFRDIFAETAGFRGRCHAIFTFHRRAAIALADFWHAERLTPFEPDHPIGRNATVVLRGLTTDAQVERLLATYLDSVRQKPTGKADPFEAATFQILRQRSDGRIGQLLTEACSLWDRAAEEQLSTISAQFVSDNLPEEDGVEAPTEAISDEDTLNALWNR